MPDARVTTLVIRDPDYSNEYVEEVEGYVETETISIDLGAGFDGRKEFRCLDAEDQAEYIEMWRDEVKHLDADGPIRQRVESLIAYMTEDDS